MLYYIAFNNIKSKLCVGVNKINVFSTIQSLSYWKLYNTRVRNCANQPPKQIRQEHFCINNIAKIFCIHE